MKFEVETTQVASTVKKMQNTLNQIEKQRKSMYRAINEMEGMWVGEAHTEFAKSFQSDDMMMQNLIREIQSFIDGVSEARKGYEQCEQDVGHMIANLRV